MHPLRMVFALVAASFALSGCTVPARPPVPRPVAQVHAEQLPGHAPGRSFGVGVRTFAFERGSDRPLPTTVWYPAAAPPGQRAGKDLPVAEGRFPVVVFSHGLGGLPANFTDLTEPLAAAGFVVIAPTYPKTSKNAHPVKRDDVVHQPADANAVLEAVLRLDGAAGDLFAGHLARSRVCATGYSAGGFTTSGMLSPNRDARLLCAVIISGGALPGGLSGSPAPVLFVHGDADDVVAYSRGRSAYDQLTWPKAFLTMHKQGHGEFLDDKRAGYGAALATITDFLRWNLYGDHQARARLRADGTREGLADIDLLL